VASETYKFRTRAQNKWGWGPYTSTPAEILAASIPYRVDIAVTTIDPITGGVKIDWTAPYYNGAEITSYTIEIQDSNSLWQSDAQCDGSDSAIVASMNCVVSMDTISTTFGYAFDSIVYVRISATNQMGTGAWSMANSDGALVRSKPGKMLGV
jgi:hypothetical protein